MKTFSIVVPPQRIVIPRLGKDYTVPERHLTLTVNEDGSGSCVAPPDNEPISLDAEDVLELCQKCANWEDLRAEHFPHIGAGGVTTQGGGGSGEEKPK